MLSLSGFRLPRKRISRSLKGLVFSQRNVGFALPVRGLRTDGRIWRLVLTRFVFAVSQLQLEDDQGVNLGLESSLTLRRLLVWTYDPKIRLKTLAALVDHCQGCSASPGPLLRQRGFWGTSSTFV